ncbi:hypothetical protein [Clostridium neuense]
MSIVTNNSMDKEKLIKFCSEINPEKIFVINCSVQEILDKNQKKMDMFLDNIKILRKHGFRAMATYVGSCERIKYLKNYYDMFFENKIPFQLLSLKGVVDGKSYPEQYSVREKTILKRYANSSIEQFLLENGSVKPTGMSCEAGFSRIFIDGVSGNIYKCSRRAGDVIGNIYENRLTLKKCGETCYERACNCTSEYPNKFLEVYYKDIENILQRNNYDENLYKVIKNKIDNPNYYNYWNKTKRDKLEQLFGECNNKTIGIYGAGNHTQNLINEYRKFFGEINFKVYIFDSDKSKQGNMCCGITILSPEDISKCNIEKMIISSYGYQDGIYKYLTNIENYNFDIVKIYKSGESNMFS